jgi:hypothetical protein
MWVAVAIGGSALVGAGASIYGANKAADAQTNAANAAIANSKSQFDTTNTNLAPFRDIGTTAATQLTGKLSNLTTPITMDESTVQATPGYQFALTQGLKGAQNSAAARGLGTSGAALKGAATFATGLADNTYQNQFSNANTNQTNAYTRLKGLVDTGENAAATTGVLGNAAVGQQNAALGYQGNAQAGAANATGSSLNSAANTVGGAAANYYKGIYGTPSSVGSTTPAVSNYNSGNPIY